MKFTLFGSKGTVREALADLIEGIDANELTPEQAATIGPLADELRAELSDDASHDALDLLNSQCVGCYFTFDSGDLLLVEDSNEGNEEEGNDGIR